MSDFERYATVVDLSYKEARIQAFWREAEGRGIARARALFPELAPFITDAGSGIAHLDLPAAIDSAREALQAIRSNVLDEPVTDEKKHFFSLLLRVIHRTPQMGLCFLPPIVGVGVAIYKVGTSDTLGGRLLGVLLGCAITYVGYALLLAARMFFVARKPARSAY
jgi:hypothetical protein